MTRISTALTALVLMVATAHAQQPTTQLDYDAMMKAPAGSWAEYAMTAKQGEQTMHMKMRYAIVAKSAKAITLEIESEVPQLGNIIMQLEYTAAGPDNWKLTKGRMKMGQQPVEEVPPDKMGDAAPLRRGDPVGKLVGTETVTTKAGSFQCKHYTKQVTMGPNGPMQLEMWMSDKALPAGLVKSTAGPAIEILLSATGVGAKSNLK
jgi:hypothetical protein